MFAFGEEEEETEVSPPPPPPGLLYEVSKGRAKGGWAGLLTHAEYVSWQRYLSPDNPRYLDDVGDLLPAHGEKTGSLRRPRPVAHQYISHI
jgi:hypothetical protein